MSDQHSFLSVDSYSRSQAAEHMLNTAITQAKISESFEEYLEIFDKFYADDIQVSSETQHEPIRGKARVGSLLLKFLVPLHVMAEVGGLTISIKETTISGDAENEMHSSWTLNIVGVSGKTCTLNWRTLRKWNGSRVVYEHHYDQQRAGEPLTFDDLGFDMIEPVAGPSRGTGIGPCVAVAINATRDRSVSSMIVVPDNQSGANSSYKEHDVRKGEQTRQEIIRKAAPIFNQKGYDGAALSDLMRATGLEKGGIYRHFESKEELAGDAFDHAWKIATDTRFEGTEKIPNTVDRLKQIVRNFRDRRDGLVPGGCPLLNAAIDSDDGNPKLRAKARQAMSSLLDRMQSIVEEGKRKGEVRSNVQSAKLATLITSTLEGSFMVSRLQRNEEPLNFACHHLEEYLETKVRAGKSKGGARN